MCASHLAKLTVAEHGLPSGDWTDGLESLGGSASFRENDYKIWSCVKSQYFVRSARNSPAILRASKRQTKGTRDFVTSKSAFKCFGIAFAAILE